MSLLDDLKNNSQNNGIIQYLDALKPLIDTVDLIATEPSGDLTIATHATTDHTGIMGVGDLTIAAHAATDHTGIMGVGEDNPAQVSPAERTAGSESALRSFAPVDVATMAGIHGSSSGVVQVIFQTPVTAVITKHEEKRV